MCGISGALATINHSNNNNRVIVEKIVQAQFSRGPDYQQCEEIHGQHSIAILGHNRLKIIDLSNNSNQPFFDESRCYSLVFNGAIYNYIELRQQLRLEGVAFTTVSDTEVLLKACMHWGVEKTLTQLNGMFAFAFFDKRLDTLWLCRDRFGVKPLYYTQYFDQFYFASSARALSQQFNLAPNLDYLARGLRYWVYEDNSELTQYEKLFTLPASHYLKVVVSENKLQLEQPRSFYNLTTEVARLQEKLIDACENQLLELVATHLNSAINIRLRADTCIGISLSGGLDSATIGAIAKKALPDLTGFTFGHPQHYHTEGPLVDTLCKKLDLKIHYIQPTSTQYHAALLQTLSAQEAPFASFSIMAQNLVYQKVKEEGIKVLLGGQGGDEAFMGYRKFFLFYLQQLLAKKQYSSLLATLISLIPSVFAELPRLGNYLNAGKRYFSKNSTYEQFIQLPSVQLPKLFSQSETSLTQRQIADIMQFSLPTLLRYEDRNSMYHSIESRLPFLDYSLIELAVALPLTLKLKHGYGKWALRESVKELLPKYIRKAKYKRGFDVAEYAWIKAGFGETLRNTLHNYQPQFQTLATKNFSIEKQFSDFALLENRALFPVAVSLIWFGMNKL